MKNRRNKFKNPRDVNKGDIRLQGILPAPGILESYEEISSGSVEKILTHIRVEQDHRHKLDHQYLKIIANTLRMGQLLTFVLAVVVIYSAVLLFFKDHYILGSLVLVLGLIFDFLFLLCYQSNAAEKIKFNHSKHSKTKDHIMM
jgi:uncharacterized membrane protein